MVPSPCCCIALSGKCRVLRGSDPPALRRSLAESGLTAFGNFNSAPLGPTRAPCAGQPVVWVNTKSKIYHHAGTNTFGHTKEGAYMCEADATAEGDRLSKNGH